MAKRGGNNNPTGINQYGHGKGTGKGERQVDTNLGRMTRDQAAHRITAQRHGQGGGHGPIETATPHGGIHARQAAAAQAANHAQSMHGAHTLHQPGQSTVHHDPTNGIDNALGQFGSEGFSGRAGKPLEKYGREYQQLLDIGRRSSANMTAAQRDRLNAKIREYK